MQANSKEIYEFSVFRLDVSERLLTRNGKRVPIADKPFQVLCVLVEGSGRLVGKDELLSRVWGETIVEENNLDKSISSLRGVLGQRNGKQKFIETVRGHGYRFVHVAKKVERQSTRAVDDLDRGRPEVTATVPQRPRKRANYSANPTNVVALADWHTAEGLQRALDPAGPPAILDRPAQKAVDAVPAIADILPGVSRSFNRQVAYAAGGSAILVALAVIMYFVYLNSSSRPASVAVLPFVNASQDPNAEYLSDGITESIINGLSGLPGLKVMSRNSAFHFKNDQSDTKHIASQLGVESLITGDINQVGDKLVINVRMIDIRDDSHVWGNQYVESITDIITVQNKIASDISRRLGAQVSRIDEKASANHTIDSRAYQTYLRGRYFSERWSEGGTRKAISYYQQAIDLDPQYAAAYAALAAAYAGVSGSKDFPRRETIAKARENVLHALAIDDQLSTAHEVYGYILFNFDYSFAAAERQFKRAIELDPNDSSARETYAGLLSALGRSGESLEQVQYAKQINPLSPGICATHGQILTSAGRLDDAADQFNAALELDARFIQAVYGLEIVYHLQGNFAKSVEQRAKILELEGDLEGAAFVKESFAREGWAGFLRDMTENGQAPRVPRYVTVSYYIELGEKDKAFDILNKMYDEGSPSVVRLKFDPRYEPLRSDPRFEHILKRLNLQ